MTTRVPSLSYLDRKEWETSVVNAFTAVINGKTNNTAELTLNENATTTTINEAHGRLGTDTIILFMPTTSTAATEYAGGSMYVSNIDIANRTFTITHSNTADDNKTFKYVLIG